MRSHDDCLDEIIEQIDMRERISLTRLILEKINEIGELTLEAMFPRGRAESMLWRNILGLPENYEFSRDTFSTILTRLKKQGLIIGKGTRRRMIWRISSKGSGRLRAGLTDSIPPKPDDKPRLVVYDIPESEKKKREWLRTALISCGYNQLQKSVWLGYCPLPEKFIREIYDRDLEKKVHLVSIHKSGTIEGVGS